MMFEITNSGVMRASIMDYLPHHRSVCRELSNKLSFVRYSSCVNGFCEYETKGLEPIGSVFLGQRKPNSEEIIGLFHSVLLALISCKKHGLFMESVILSPRYIYVGHKSVKPKLVYVPQETDYDIESEYKSLVSFFDNMYDEKNQLAQQLISAFKKIGFNLHEAARVLVDAAKNGRVDGKYSSAAVFHKKEPVSIEDDNRTISLLEETETIGNKEAYLKLLDSDVVVEIEIATGNFLIGRKQGAVDYCFDGKKFKGVSRIHAAVKFDGGMYYIEDKGSSGGTFLNGKRLPAHRLEPLSFGDEVTLYKTRLRFCQRTM